MIIRYDLDEAIEYCDEVAERLRKQGKRLKRADDHEQLATWLRELKFYRGLFKDYKENKVKETLERLKKTD